MANVMLEILEVFFCPSSDLPTFEVHIFESDLNFELE